MASWRTYSRQSFLPARRRVLYLVLLILTSILAIIALVVPLSTRSFIVALSIGDVASQDILAPRAISYESVVQTEAKQLTAVNAVDPVYAPHNASVARAQVARLRATVNFIETVRIDGYATPEQKLADLAALQDIYLSQESAQAFLDMNESSWQSVHQEAISVLEQLMRSTIQEDRLEEARRRVPAMVSLSMQEDQAVLVAELVSAFVAPNSLYSEELTDAKRNEAHDTVLSVIQSYAANETIIRRGQVVTAIHVEALEQLGLASQQTTWVEYVRATSYVSLGAVLIVLFFNQRKELLNEPRILIISTLLFIASLYLGRFIIPNRTIIPYFFPSATFALVIASLFSAQAAMIFAIPLSLLTTYGLNNEFELALYFLIPSLLGVLTLRRAQRWSGVIWSGATISFGAIAIILTFRLGDPDTDFIGLLQLLGASMANGLLSAATALVLQTVLAQMLGMTTVFQLQDISRPDHPLLQHILRTAPGTYQHSLQIANLAEQAAEAIGANATLVRVGALYHDAGKTEQPIYFIENQIPGSPNPHDSLPPLESSRKIIEHVTQGIELANKHRLPESIKAFIREHHGTLATMYQYAKAVEAAGGDRSLVDRSSYQYPGPRPQSRETALVMLADGCEARARAERPETKEALFDMVKNMIERRLTQGQLDDTEMTMQDLSIIIESFTTTLRGVYHPRIKYPELDEISKPIPTKESAPTEQ